MPFSTTRGLLLAWIFDDDLAVVEDVLHHLQVLPGNTVLCFILNLFRCRHKAPPCPGRHGLGVPTHDVAEEEYEPGLFGFVSIVDRTRSISAWFVVRRSIHRDALRWLTLLHKHHRLFPQPREMKATSKSKEFLHAYEDVVLEQRSKESFVLGLSAVVDKRVIVDNMPEIILFFLALAGLDDDVEALELWKAQMEESKIASRPHAQRR